MNKKITVFILGILSCVFIFSACNKKNKKENNKSEIKEINVSVIASEPKKINKSDFTYTQDYLFSKWQDSFIENKISYKGNVKVSEYEIKYEKEYLFSDKIYKNGVLTEDYSYVNEHTKDEYIYENENKLLKINSYYVYRDRLEFFEACTIYLEYDEESENSCMKYNMGNRIFKTITRKETESGYEFTTFNNEKIEDIRTYTFDDEGRISKFASSQENPYADIYITYFEYDNNGMLKAVQKNSFRKNQRETKCFRYIYEYDETGKLIRKTFRDFDSKNPEIYEDENYIFSDFDINGIWTKCSIENNQDSKVVYSRKIEYLD